MMVYRIITAVLDGALKIGWLFRVKGKENIPKEGSFLLCANHRSNMDPVMIAAGCHRQLTFMAKEELFKVPVLGWLIKKFGAFPIKRGKGDAAAVMATLKILKRGEATLIFPEGTRMKDGTRKNINPGIIRLAMQAKVPILPAYVDKHSVTFGKPITYENMADSISDAEKMQALADDLMDTIYNMG